MRVLWDAVDQRPYSHGVSQGVLYIEDFPGVPWNGLVSVTEAGEQIDDPQYLDGRRFHNRNSSSLFSGSISAITYPDEFEPCIGISDVVTSQIRQSFGFSYRTNNQIHLVYNALISPSKVDHNTFGEKIDPVIFQWDFTTLPEKIPGGKPSSHLVIMVDSSQPSAISDLEALIYGDDVNDSSLPSPETVVNIFESYTGLRITDNGDGTWTADDSGQAITIIDANTFKINWPSVIYVGDDKYVVSSL